MRWFLIVVPLLTIFGLAASEDVQPVIVTTILTNPFCTRKLDDSPTPRVGNDRYEGYIPDLMHKVSEIVGFNYTLTPVKDGKYGSRGSDGTWNGMVGELTRHEADIAAAALTITSMRERVVDFSKPYMNVGIQMITKKPYYDFINANFLSPFTVGAWVMILVAFGVSGAFVYLLTKCVPESSRKPCDDKKIAQEVTQCCCTAGAVAFLCNCTSSKGKETSKPVKIFLCFWVASAALTVVVYMALLVQWYPVQGGSVKQTMSFSDVESLLTSEMSFGSVKGGSTYSFFRTSTIPVYEKVYALMEHHNAYVYSNEEGIERVRQGGYVLFAESTTIDYVNQRQPCNTMAVGGRLNMNAYGLATPLGSEYREAISLAILQLRENGVLQKLEKKWWYDKGECPRTRRSPTNIETPKIPSPMTAHHFLLAGPVLVLAIGGILALLVAAIHIVNHKCIMNDKHPINDGGQTTAEITGPFQEV